MLFKFVISNQAPERESLPLTSSELPGFWRLKVLLAA